MTDRQYHINIAIQRIAYNEHTRMKDQNILTLQIKQEEAQQLELDLDLD